MIWNDFDDLKELYEAYVSIKVCEHFGARLSRDSASLSSGGREARPLTDDNRCQKKDVYNVDIVLKSFHK